MRVAPMRMDVAEPSDSVSSPFAVLTTIELADASYFSSVPVIECAAAFFAPLAVCAGEADAVVATASARMPAPSNWIMRDMDRPPLPECGRCLDLTKTSAMPVFGVEMQQTS